MFHVQRKASDFQLSGAEKKMLQAKVLYSTFWICVWHPNVTGEGFSLKSQTKVQSNIN